VLGNPDSIPDMRKAILATLYHKCSTDAKPQHQYCPTGADSWCSYQKAKAKKESAHFKHPPAFDEETLNILKPIYEDLTSDDTLERCLGANTQNNNECFNSLVWNIAPKHKFVGKQNLEIAVFSAACVFNEGISPILKIMEIMGVKIGPTAENFVEKVNDKRIDKAELQASNTS